MLLSSALRYIERKKETNFRHTKIFISKKIKWNKTNDDDNDDDDEHKVSSKVLRARAVKL